MNITNVEAVHLLINTYMINQLNSAGTPVEEEEFIDYVQKILIENNFSYTREQVLITWRKLLEKYDYFKENVSMKEASETWPLFSLMDTCFNESKSTNNKFSDPNLTFNLIKCMSDYKQILLNRGLTMNILRNVEKKLKHLENNLNQRDIYIQWTNLKNCYEDKDKQIQSQNSYNEFLEDMEFYIYNAQDGISGGNSKRLLCETKEVSTKKLKKFDTQNDSICFNTIVNNSSSNVTNDEQGKSRKGYDNSKLLVENVENIYNCNILTKEESLYESGINKKEGTIIKGNEDVSGLLKGHETGYRELEELKELLLENNLLRNESKYLLNLFSDKIKSRSIEPKKDVDKQ